MAILGHKNKQIFKNSTWPWCEPICFFFNIMYTQTQVQCSQCTLDVHRQYTLWYTDDTLAYTTFKFQSSIYNTLGDMTFV